MPQPSATDGLAVQWECQPKPWAFICRQVEQFATANSTIAAWRVRLLKETGTRLVDWIDHLSLNARQASDDELDQLGFCRNGGSNVWSHPKGLFPLIRRSAEEVSGGESGLAIKVESVDRFLNANQLPLSSVVLGDIGSDLCMALIDAHANATLWIVERHGNPAFTASTPLDRERIDAELRQFTERPRAVDPTESGFVAARQRFDHVAQSLGRDRACDLFFESERRYWQQRNQAARVQRKRQDALGLGWANHDHHTYRSSRLCFAPLVATLEHMGFVCRERFYAGAESGWGAQVLEQPKCRIVVFADVDMSPDEVTGDFAHEGLSARDNLGTVGLWCRLHGESFLRAGMHHLECQFDFDAVRRQLADEGIATMDPFTDFPFLRQAFTEGERWSIDTDRLNWLVRDECITPEQAEEFRQHGAIGSHLEILQRNDGYKGFNQTGVSDIIRRTDPRRT